MEETPGPTDRRVQLVESISNGLPDEQVAILYEVAKCLQVPVPTDLNPSSNIVTTAFAADFENRLKLYHALTEEPMSKKAFEYAFLRASMASYKEVFRTRSSVHPGEDVRIDGVPFSLKTEADQGISRTSIKVSKFMEARWLRECDTPEEYLAAIQERVVPHLQRYARILDLRVFTAGQDSFTYKLVEVPKDVLLAVTELRPEDINQKADNSISIPIHYQEKRAFTLRLDLSVEKVTISSLKESMCIHHGTWTIPVQRVIDLVDASE